MSTVKIKILLNGIWTEIPHEELKNYTFKECIIEELMTKEEYNKTYCEFNNAHTINKR